MVQRELLPYTRTWPVQPHPFLIPSSLPPLHSLFPSLQRCCSWIGPALFNTSLEQGPILPSHVQDVVATAKHGSDTWVVPWGPW